MATRSYQFSDLTATQRRGLQLAIVGLLLFASYPLSRLAEIYGYTDVRYGLSIIVSPYGACVLVWGLFALRTGKRRPLTPWRALLAPALAIAMFVGVDLLTEGQLLEWLNSQPSWTELDLGRLVWEFYSYSWFVGASAYAVLGAAVRVRRWRPLLGATGLVAALLWFIYQYPFESHPPVLGLTIFGFIPFLVGFRATSTPEDVTPLADILLERSAAQWRGMKLVAVGLVLFAAFPVTRLVGVFGYGHGASGILFLSTYGACILVWGLYVYRTETERPLTPKRALLIPLVVIAMAAAVDLLTRQRLIEWWVHAQGGGPLHSIDTLGVHFDSLLQISASTYVVFGSAIRSERWPAVLASVGLLLGFSWILELMPEQSYTFLGVAIFGIVPAIIGYRATRLPGDSLDE